LQRSAFTLASFAPVVEMHELAGQALSTPLVVRELLWGDNAVLVEMSAPAGFAAPLHAHEHESLVYVLSGRMRATVDDETRELGPGDAVLHLVGARHLIEAMVETRWIEIKAPPRATWPTAGPDHLRRQ
jgi:quercetin dioxygenase-like cupin family protein